MKRLVATLVGGCMLMTSGIAYAGDKAMYQEITDHKPDVGVSTTVYLGDRMLQQRRGQYQECIIPKFSSEKKDFLGVNRFIVKANEPLCRPAPNEKKYVANTYRNFFNSAGGGFSDNKVNYKPVGKDKFKLCSQTLCTDEMDVSQIDTSPYFVYTINTFQQSIEYGGRSGDILKFTYSEFTDGFARQAFTREFQVDLTQGKVAAYKGAVIEIESATNSSITYKVVRNFQQ